MHERTRAHVSPPVAAGRPVGLRPALLRRRRLEKIGVPATRLRGHGEDRAAKRRGAKRGGSQS